MLGRIADELARGVERISAALSEAFFETVIRLGVTGLARSGKTVFITSLVANLMDRGRMGQLRGAANIRAAWLQPQPDLTLPRFDYETHLAALTAEPPRWPASTRSISELRLSLRVEPGGLLAGLTGPRAIHLDIVDYPGEWLLDLGLLGRSYADWSAEVLRRAVGRAHAAAFLGRVAPGDAAAPHSEARARELAALWTETLRAARAAGLADCTPGRFLMPGALEGSPVLTFAPLPAAEGAPRGSLGREMARRYDGYVREVVRPFFRDHFARIDRQVVLVDVLGAIHAGPRAVEDLRRSMADLLAAFRPGGNSLLSQLLAGRRVERVLFAATKADHVHHGQHGRLTAITQALLRDAKARADFAGARTEAMAIAALRATSEETRSNGGAELPMVRGVLLETRKPAALYPGELPDNPGQLLGPAREGAERWLDADYALMAFAPPPLGLRPGVGPPHIRLDRAAEFLIGDHLV